MMEKIIQCSSNDYAALSEIWERSVRATHYFLSEKDIIEIREALIASYFPNVDLYAVVDSSMLVGFIGLKASRIEMLFVDSIFRGRGYGSILIDYAKEMGCCHVDVNEQNPAALKFYMGKGFRIVGRDETDDSGRPFPILHLSL